MHVMIAGTDTSTMNRLASHLSVCGHSSEITRNGLECVAALGRLIPDLLILEFGILWGGSAGVMAVMDGDPDLANVPVVLFAGGYQHPDFRKHPRIVASLTHPVQPHELSSLKGLLIKIASICGVARFPVKRMGQFAADHKGIPPHNGDGGFIRQTAFKVPSISAPNGRRDTSPNGEVITTYTDAQPGLGADEVMCLSTEATEHGARLDRQGRQQEL